MRYLMYISLYILIPIIYLIIMYIAILIAPEYKIYMWSVPISLMLVSSAIFIKLNVDDDKELEKWQNITRSK